MNRPRIISLGEVLWDLFPDGECFGGAPANFACYAATLGGDVTLVSAVGDDGRGREAIRKLETFGIDTSLVQTIASAPTGTVGIELNTEGKPHFTIHEGSAWDRLEWTAVLESKVAAADAVYFGTLGQRGEASRLTIRRALETAKAAEVTCVLDINLRAPYFDDDLIRESIERASILKLSDDEFGTVTRACGVAFSGNPVPTLQTLRESTGLEAIVMTRGADGALVVSAQEVAEHPGVPTEVIDTVGAGDAFAAAFLLGWLRGEPMPTVLRDACRIAAGACAHPGGIPPNPVHSLT